MSRDPITIREYRPGDERGLVDCYNRIFPTADGAIGARTLAHWRWKFVHNPIGEVHTMLAAHDSDGVVGAYTGIPLRIFAEGRRQQAAQAVDLMVLPEWRRHGEAPGLFVALGRRWIERFMGTGERQNLFTFGWPVPAWRAGQRWLEWLNIRDWDFLFRELSPDGERRAVPAELDVVAVERFGADVDALYTALEPSFGLVVVRDARYLNWRYADHPEFTYRLLECRERGTGRLRGICVYTKSGLLRADTAYVVDWLAPADDVDATAAMLGRCEQLARQDRAPVLALVFNQIDPRFLAVQRLGYLVQGTHYFLVLRTTRFETTFYREQWYLTMGDSDLV